MRGSASEGGLPSGGELHLRGSVYLDRPPPKIFRQTPSPKYIFRQTPLNTIRR